MKRSSTIRAMAAATVLAIGATCMAQTEVRFEPAKSEMNTVRVEGTSTLHDWHVETEKISGSLVAIRTDDGLDLTADLRDRARETNATIAATITVRDLKNEDSGLNKKMYEALKEKTNKEISYAMNRCVVVSVVRDPNAWARTTYNLSTQGHLTVAGRTVTVSIPMTAIETENNELVISLEKSLKMTDFGVKPPTAMLGFIKSGDDINVTIRWVLKPVEQAQDH